MPEINWQDRAIKAEAEVEYLRGRAIYANGGRGESGRETGISSNHMVDYALGGTEPHESCYPYDRYDLAACYRARNRAPKHMQPRMDALLSKYEAFVEQRYPGSVEAAKKATLQGGPRHE